MRWVLVLLLVLLSSSARAQQPPVETIPPGEDVVTPLSKGQPAPFPGQLFDTDTALRWANWLMQYKYRLVWDVEKERQVCAAEMDYRDSLLRAEEARAQTVEKDLEERLSRSEQARLKAEEELRNPPWYSTWTFGVAVGVVSTAVIFGISVAAVNATRSP